MEENQQKANCRKKKSYNTKKIAKMYANMFKKYKRQTLDVYKCPICRRFHLTRNGRPKILTDAEIRGKKALQTIIDEVNDE